MKNSILIFLIWISSFLAFTSFANDSIDSRTFSRDVYGETYSLENFNQVIESLELLDKQLNFAVSESISQEALIKIGSAIDLYQIILQDTRLPGSERINYTSRLEGGIYQALITLLRHRGADRVDVNRMIPNRSMLKKLFEEVLQDLKSYTTRSKDFNQEKIYEPLERVNRDQTTQHAIVKLQSFARFLQTVQDGDDGDLRQNSKDMLNDIFIQNSQLVIKDRKVAHWITAGFYGVMAVASFFIIVDYVGFVDKIMGGYGSTEMSRLVTGILNFSMMFTASILKAGSIRGHTQKMINQLSEILKGKDLPNSEVKRSMAAILFRLKVPQIDSFKGMSCNQIFAH